MSADKTTTLVWDWSVRLFHWLMVLLIPLMWWTAEQGFMAWHKRLGLFLFGLIVFRLFWGIAGAWTARFLPMIARLKSAPAYARELFKGRHSPSFGHNPMGVLSVMALILTLSVQVGTGLFAVDVDGLESGPLGALVSFDAGRQLAEIHEQSFNILVAFIVLHIAAVAVYRFVLKDDLIKPMVTGRRPREDFEDASLPKNRLRPVVFTLCAGLAAASVYIVTNIG